MILTPRHLLTVSLEVRAGDWKQDRLASEAGVGLSTVKGYEGGKSKPIGATLAAMRAALEKAGVTFLDGEALGNHRS